MSTVQPSSTDFGSIFDLPTQGPGKSPEFPEVTPPVVDWQPVWDLIRRLPSYARLTAAMAKDKRVPASAKSILVISGAYLVSPLDLIPGLIPVAGQLDDLYVVLIGLQQAMRMTPQAVVDEHLAAAGHTTETISNDLAALRAFVRQGIQWTFQRGGMAVAAVSRQAMSLVERARTWGATRNDTKQIKPQSSP